MQDTDPHSDVSVSISPAQLAAWIRLERTHGIGPRTAPALLAAFGGDPAAIFAADGAALAAHVTPAQARAILQPPSRDTQRLVEATARWLEQPGHALLALGQPAYPDLLAQIPDPPLLLYIKGHAELLAGPALAIVGSRNASTQGKLNAHAFAAALAGAGLSIVSGLALGVDTAAHEGALAGGLEGGPEASCAGTRDAARRGAGGTIAVIGTGPDLVYPARNRALFDRIAEAGCIVSEYPVGTPPLPSNFPKRNRIISGLAAGVLVVEAAAQSGSLITARQAAEQGREVFAIPGSIHAALSKGCHLLIREGAKLVDGAADILEALAYSPLVRRPPMASARPPEDTAPAPADDALLAALGHDPVAPDVLLALVGCTPAELGTRLLLLELAGSVERLPGGRIQRLMQGA